MCSFCMGCIGKIYAVCSQPYLAENVKFAAIQYTIILLRKIERTITLTAL